MGALSGMINRCLMLLWMCFSSPLILHLFASYFPSSPVFLSTIKNSSFSPVFASPPAGAVSDHGSGDHDPVIAAGRLLCLCCSSGRLLCLHHPGGALRTQGAPTRPPTPLRNAAHAEKPARFAAKSKGKAWRPLGRRYHLVPVNQNRRQL